MPSAVSNQWTLPSDPRLFHALVCSALLIASACSRTPYDLDRPSGRREGEYDYYTVLENQSIRGFQAASGPDGALALLVALPVEVRLLSGSEGAWMESACWPAADSVEVLSLAAGPAGSWWTLCSEGVDQPVLRRVAGTAVDVIPLPAHPETRWEAGTGAVAASPAGDPVLVLRARYRGLYCLTGPLEAPAMTWIPETGTGGSTVLALAVDVSGTAHLILHTETPESQYWCAAVTEGTIARMERIYDPDGRATAEAPIRLAIDDTWAACLVSGLLGRNTIAFWRMDPESGWWVETLPIWEREVTDRNLALALCGGELQILFTVVRPERRFDLERSIRHVAGPMPLWQRLPVVGDVPRWEDTPLFASYDRIRSFELAADDQGRPHIFFLDGDPAVTGSSLIEAVPR
jgi:hypothetical protein